ncbi:MAG: 1-acyl-sn-glycerol-3-phosphate acyltransferase [Prevotella sp.]|nr:1-acyl-sn-glycerol-3-phosphate acyltransferase [Prevotella sp.]
MKKLPRTIYYQDELNDDFEKKNIQPIRVDQNYQYLRRGWLPRLDQAFWYWWVAYPVVAVHARCKFHWQVKNKHLLKQAKKQAFFLYGNHTQDFFDAYLPLLLNAPRPAYVIVNPENVSIRGLGWLIKKMGALPLATDLGGTRNFIKALDTLVANQQIIAIYPEAHIWPYYTKIRPFPATSFRYPVKYNVPTYVFTNTYQKRKHGRTPKIVTYIDGPFYPDQSLPLKKCITNLRDRVYNTMVERSKNSNMEVIQYIQQQKEQ